MLELPYSQPHKQIQCSAEGCGKIFYVCASCWRGQRYCSEECSSIARRQQQRQSSLRYQKTPEGRETHNLNQRDYYLRECEKARSEAKEIQIDHGSPEEEKDVWIETAPVVAAHFETTPAFLTRASHHPPSEGPSGVVYCRICGAPGRFINPYWR